MPPFAVCRYLGSPPAATRLTLKPLLDIGVDSALEPDQSKIPVEMIKALLAEATGKDADGKPLLTIEDLSRFSARRRVEARETNPDFTLEKIHKSFGSSK